MFAQRCARRRKHRPHWVPSHGDITGFTCAGHSPAATERQLTEAFGPE